MVREQCVCISNEIRKSTINIWQWIKSQLNGVDIHEIQWRKNRDEINKKKMGRSMKHMFSHIKICKYKSTSLYFITVLPNNHSTHYSAVLSFGPYTTDSTLTENNPLKTHICLKDFPILINWTSPVPILGVSGPLFHFYYISNGNSC